MRYMILRSLAFACLCLKITGTSFRTDERYGRHRVTNRSVIQIHQSTFPYLSDSTTPFFVNGTSLPDVDFDIGESYAGMLPVDETGKELFFWFVPSQNPSASNEITVWLNGGPGCSSLYGFFHEQGPIIWHPGSYSPIQNVWSWVGLTNMVWIDQPIGTGYSRGGPSVTSSREVAVQFLSFWTNFVDLFNLNGRRIYITGESYAGQYVPYIADAMLSKGDMEYFNMRGILLYNPSFGWPQISKQVTAAAFLDYNHNSFPFNRTFIAQIHNISATCGYDSFLSESLQFPPEGRLRSPPGLDSTRTLLKDCDVYHEILRAIKDTNPCFNIYQVSQLCPVPWDVLEFPYTVSELPARFNNPYFNRTDVKEVIHAPLDTEWTVCSEQSVFVNDTDLSPPSALNGGPLQRVIEKTNNSIIAHGVLDMVLIVNGTLLTLQNLTWNGIQGFSTPPVQPFNVPYIDSPFVGGHAQVNLLGDWVSERGLTFCTVLLSGHEVPMYQPAAAYRHMELLLGRISNLSDISPFTAHPIADFST